MRARVQRISVPFEFSAIRIAYRVPAPRQLVPLNARTCTSVIKLQSCVSVAVSCSYLSAMADHHEKEGSDTLEQLLGSSSDQGQSGSYWNVQSEFGFPSWPGDGAHDYESLQIEVSIQNP